MGNDTRIRYDLLECKKCHVRAWSVDQKAFPNVFSPNNLFCKHEWWSKQTFFATDNGPGLHPTQIEDKDDGMNPYEKQPYGLH